jgi:hypothetical protein
MVMADEPIREIPHLVRNDGLSFAETRQMRESPEREKKKPPKFADTSEAIS